MNLNPKVTAGGLAAAATLLIVAALEAAGVTVRPEVASALTLILSVAAAYLKSQRDWEPKQHH